MDDGNCTANGRPCGAHGSCTANFTCECDEGWHFETGFVSAESASEYCFVWISLEQNVWFVVFLLAILHAAIYFRDLFSRICGCAALPGTRPRRAPISCVNMWLNIASHIFLLCGSQLLAASSGEQSMLGRDAPPSFLVFNHLACESILGELFLMQFAEYFEKMRRSRLHRITSRQRLHVGRGHLLRSVPFTFIICNLVALSSVQDSTMLKLVAVGLLCIQGLFGIFTFVHLIFPILSDLRAALDTANNSDGRSVVQERIHALFRRMRWLFVTGISICAFIVALIIVSVAVPIMRRYISIFVALVAMLGKLPRVVLGQKESVFELKTQKTRKLRIDLQYIKEERPAEDRELIDIVRENIMAVEDFVHILRSGSFAGAGPDDSESHIFSDLFSLVADASSLSTGAVRADGDDSH